MENRGIYIFIGPPFSGKETQTTPLSKELGIPVFSMGALIRKAREDDPAIEAAFQNYTTKGLHVPIDIKFDLLKKEMDDAPQGFILDNFPATSQDLEALNSYLTGHNLEVNKVFYLNIGREEIIKRLNEMPDRGRMDDTIEAITTRSQVQADDRQPVLEFYRNEGKLVEINGEQSIEKVSSEIHNNL